MTMSGTKEFFDLVAKDKDVKIELGTETLKALTALLAEKGLKDEARKTIDAVMMKVAEAHGFKLFDMEELSEEELAAVAGGEKTIYCNKHYENDCNACNQFIHD